KQCEKRDPCPPEYCNHGGRCSSNGTGFECVCPLGFDGPQCEHDINECDSSPCAFGKCVNTVGFRVDFMMNGPPRDQTAPTMDRCECSHEFVFVGVKLIFYDQWYVARPPIRLCLSGNTPPTFTQTHTANSGDERTNAQFTTSDCAPQRMGSYRCECDEGFIGRDCQIYRSGFECSSNGPNVCRNGGVCVSDEINNNNACICPPMYQ
ncbi:EGF-like domain protein, partial [Ostertagia ostertagi]